MNGDQILGSRAHLALLRATGEERAGDDATPHPQGTDPLRAKTLVGSDGRGIDPELGNGVAQPEEALGAIAVDHRSLL